MIPGQMPSAVTSSSRARRRAELAAVSVPNLNFKFKLKLQPTRNLSPADSESWQRAPGYKVTTPRR